MSQKTTPKRFVAGARCPECNAMDTTVCYYEDQVFVRECIECDFFERITDEDSGGKEPESSSTSKVSPAQVIKIKEL